jgi:hypothetical protein
MAELVLGGMTDLAASQQLGVGRRAVSRVRALLAVPPVTNRSTALEKIAVHTVPLDDGHTGWTGRRNTCGGAPIIRHRGIQTSVTATLFEERTGRPPVGMCVADCGYTHCLTPSHIEDDMQRRDLRLQLRALRGMPAPWDTCVEGHSWDADGRVSPGLKLHCKACGTARSNRSRASREEASADA